MFSSYSKKIGYYTYSRAVPCGSALPKTKHHLLLVQIHPQTNSHFLWSVLVNSDSSSPLVTVEYCYPLLSHQHALLLHVKHTMLWVSCYHQPTEVRCCLGSSCRTSHIGLLSWLAQFYHCIPCSHQQWTDVVPCTGQLKYLSAKYSIFKTHGCHHHLQNFMVAIIVLAGCWTGIIPVLFVFLCSCTPCWE